MFLTYELNLVLGVLELCLCNKFLCINFTAKYGVVIIPAYFHHILHAFLRMKHKRKNSTNLFHLSVCYRSVFALVVLLFGA